MVHPPYQTLRIASPSSEAFSLRYRWYWSVRRMLFLSQFTKVVWLLLFELTLADTRFKIECSGFCLLKNSEFNITGCKATFEFFVHDFLSWNRRAFNIASNAPCSPLRDREPQRVSRDSGGTGLLGAFPASFHFV
jgi:hypothetical protein